MTYVVVHVPLQGRTRNATLVVSGSSLACSIRYFAIQFC
jgi:hypothetical protein